MKGPVGLDMENVILFCTRPWRLLAMVVAILMTVTFVWGGIVLGTYHNDRLLGSDRTLSVTEFLARNIAMSTSLNLPDTIAPAVVAIDGGKINGDVVASGAIVGASGYVLTTLHSVEALPDIIVRVRTTSGVVSFPAQIVKKAPAHDLVMLKLKSPGSFLYLSLANTAAGQGAETVLAFGQGLQNNLIVRQGSISAQPVPLAIENSQISHLRVTDAVYTWEQNGGPVVNVDGAMVGVALAVQDAAGSVRGYVVPADVINAHFGDVVKFKIAAAVASSAVVAAPPQVALSQVAPGPRMIEAGLSPMSGMTSLIPGAEMQPKGAAGWWLRAAIQVGGVAQPIGVTAAPNGPPLMRPVLGPEGDVEHVLGFRIVGFSVGDLIGLTLLALAKGVIGGMMTMGGGVFLVAGMMMFFGYGLFLIRPVAYLTNIFVYSASSLHHHRNGLVMWDKVKSLAPWAVVGVVLGYFIGNSIGDRVVEILLAVFAVLIAIKAAHEVLVAGSEHILLARNGEKGEVPHENDDDLDLMGEDVPNRSFGKQMDAVVKSALLGLPMGILSGILGITGGVVEVPLQHYLDKVPLKNAIANSAVVVFFASLAGAVLSFIHGTATGLIDWRAPLALAAILIPASFVGGVIGAHLTKLAPKPVLKGIFSVLMLAVAIKMFIGH
ncbi:MAG: TSUP family transporter [Rhodospirillaceae bacterium]